MGFFIQGTFFQNLCNNYVNDHYVNVSLIALMSQRA